MRLNRYNYEEFFILYMDNELDAEGRREVEAFVQHNPDLKAELDMLMQSKLTPDTDISFADKGSLLRFDNASISLGNYEEWLTSYIDNELTEEERKSVEEFVAIHPAIQKELNLLQQAKLQPEEIVFPDKESLYRRTEKARIISIRWIRIAAAAVLLFGISTTAIVLLNNNKGKDANGSTASKQKEQSKDNGAVQHPATTPSNNLAVLPGTEIKDEANKKDVSNAIVVNQSNNAEENKEQNEIKDEKRQIALNSDPIKDNLTNNPTEPTHNANGNEKGAVDGTTEIVGSPVLPKDTQENTNNSDVTKSSDVSSIIQTGAVKKDNSDVQFASDNSNRGLRGFFRKVTRTIEKRTNIKTTNDDDRLLIAGLAIKM